MSMSDRKEQFYQKTIVVWLGALICCALWGSAFPSIKIGYRLFSIDASDTFTQILFAGSRFTLAGILAVLIGSVTQKKVLLPKRASLSLIARLSVMQTILQYIFFYVGLAHTTGVKASIVEATNVFVTIFVASLLFHQEKLTGRKLLGSFIGFLGVVIINLAGNETSLSFNISGDGCILLSTIAYAFSSVYLKIYSKQEDPVVLSGYQFILGGLVMCVIGLIGGGEITIITPRGLLLLTYLGLISAVAYSLWGILLKYNPVSKVTVFGLMNPVFGVILSAILLRESGSLQLVSLLSLVLVCLGIYIVNR